MLVILQAERKWFPTRKKIFSSHERGRGTDILMFLSPQATRINRRGKVTENPEGSAVLQRKQLDPLRKEATKFDGYEYSIPQISIQILERNKAMMTMDKCRTPPKWIYSPQSLAQFPWNPRICTGNCGFAIWSPLHHPPHARESEKRRQIKSCPKIK